MKPEVKDQWLTALRSGDYPQAKGYLRRLLKNDETEGFCCLGVMCNLYQEKTGNGQWSGPTRFGSGFRVNVDEIIPEKTDLPKEVREWSGLTDDDLRGFLAEKNDGDWTFAQIADWIEENL